MWSYVTEELPHMVGEHFPVDPMAAVHFRHSMVACALTDRATYPDRYRAASAFAPVVAPAQVPWGIKALRGISRRQADMAQALMRLR